MPRTSFVLSCCLVLIGVVAVRHYGWLDGLGAVAIVYCLMPHKPGW